MYPLIFVLIILICLAFLIPHQQLMRRLARVEEAAARLEDALRERLDLISGWAAKQEPDEALAALAARCEAARDGEPEALLNAWPKIDRLLVHVKIEALAENDERLFELAREYNERLAPYTAMLGKFPWRLYAGALMLKNEKDFK